LSIKIRTGARFLCIILLLTLILVYPLSWFSCPAQNRALSKEGSHIIIIADIVPHSSINISNNQDFVLQGWPGAGIEENPYRIESLNIDATGSCINVSNTNVFFIVTGCALNAPSDEDPYCVYFHNVTNGAIEDCIIDSYNRGIIFEDCENCSIEHCEIDTRFSCIYFESSFSCIITTSTMTSDSFMVWANDCSNLEVSQNDMSISNSNIGIAISGSTDFGIRNNSVHGHYGEGITIYDSLRGVIANNSIKNDQDYGGYSGVELNNVTDCSLLNNNVSQNDYGFHLHHGSQDCLIESNLIHDNYYGIWTSSINDTYSKNTFNANLYSNAEDGGKGNLWLQNWWDDYVGYGWYPIPGAAGSFDTDPAPKNDALLVGTITSIAIILLGSFTLIAVITRRVQRGALIDSRSTTWDIKERLTLPLLVTMLLPTDIFLYFPAYSPARWLILGATPLGVISWTAYPSWGHHALEFIFPLMDSIQISLYYALFGLLWFMLSAFLVRRFWLFTGGDLEHVQMKRTAHSILLIMILMSLITLTIPIPLTPLATLLQISRFNKTGVT